MATTTRPARVWVSGAASLLALLGPAAGALGAEASAASRTPSAMAPAGRPLIPAPGQSSALQGVSCPSSTSCWAVGSYTIAGGARVNQALRWNGARWSNFPVPSPGGTAMTDISELLGVGCASPRSCWAVGVYANANRAYLNQALHWNGARWSSAPVPSPGGTELRDASELQGVRCTSPGDCWAVGFYINGNGANGPHLNQAIHWNGSTWSLVPTPDPGGTGPGTVSGLSAVACTAPANCWAVGFYLNASGADLNQVLRWNGSSWSLFPTPDPAGPAAGRVNILGGVACIASADCWAVGFYGGAALPFLNQVLHWNGTRWSVFASPDPGGFGPEALNMLHGVACTSSADCWAVGVYGFGSGATLNQALHWNGRSWSLVATPNPAGAASGDLNDLNSVRCTSPANCWAVGVSKANGQPARNQALRWNGSRWSVG